MIPDGLQVSQCTFGECVDKLKDPVPSAELSVYRFLIETIALDSAGIIGINLAGVIVLAILAFSAFAYIDIYKRRHTPAPPDRQGSTIEFDHICYSLGNKFILNDVCGSVNPGEVLGI